MKIIDVAGRPVKAIFQMEYGEYDLSFSTMGCPVVGVFTRDGSTVLESFYGDTALTDAMAFINRGCTRLAA